MRPTQKGVADIICVAPFRDFGLPVAIEVKTEEGKLTDNQKDFLLRWQKRGGIASVARSVEDAIKLESKLKNIHFWEKGLGGK